MNNICTSIEQSKKLIELGIDIDTADMYHIDLVDEVGYIYGTSVWVLDNIEKLTIEHYETPAWSLSALLELMPQRIYMHGAAHQFRLDRNWDKVTWQCAYDAMNSFIEKKSNSPIDAVFEMMCWLFENNFFKKGDNNDQ